MSRAIQGRFLSNPFQVTARQHVVRTLRGTRRRCEVNHRNELARRTREAPRYVALFCLLLAADPSPCFLTLAAVSTWRNVRFLYAVRLFFKTESIVCSIIRVLTWYPSCYNVTPWRSWLRHCVTRREVAGSIPDYVIGIFHWHNPSGRTVALESTQPLTEMSTRNISWVVKA